MAVLTTQQRNTLESAVTKARKLAETGARNALFSLAVDNPEPFPHMSPEQRALRNRLRNKARLLDDELPASGHQQIDRLSYELAYENWHKMLFAKFLVCNDLLIYDSVSVTLEECEELAREQGFLDKWDAAANYASKMLPAIFRTDDPLMQVSFAGNDRIKLEEIIDALEPAIFTADDSLGWVYQYWQNDAKRKVEEEEKKGKKIDGASLPAKTQLFTEPYMVHFLIDNTLGAWWVSRNPGVTPPVKFEYLRMHQPDTELVEVPAAGKFEGWPDKTKGVTSLDPCMGSGHFVASLFPVFASLRMYEEGLTKEEATDRVITENLHGLELDARCTQIAAFNLALTAWKFCGHYKELPEMNLACSGIAPKGKVEDWIKLVGNVAKDDQGRMENGMKMLYDHFQLAPELGSLLDPATIKADAFTASFEQLQPVLAKALEGEADKDLIERGVMAAGIAKAGQLLAQKYTLQITNVPFLSLNKQSDILHKYAKLNFENSRHDLATIFIEKLIRASNKGGTLSAISPQNWNSSTRYAALRKDLLKNYGWNFISRLGVKSFQTPMWDFNVLLFSLSNNKTLNESVFSIDVSASKTIDEKINNLKNIQFSSFSQSVQLLNPDHRIIIEDISSINLLGNIAESRYGLRTSDSNRFIRTFWEVKSDNKSWNYHQSSVSVSKHFGGRENVLFWDEGVGDLNRYAELGLASLQGSDAWHNKGIVISLIGKLPVTIYDTSFYDNNCAVIWPKDISNYKAIYCFLESSEFNSEVRKLDQALKVMNATLLKIPFDLEHWQKVAEEKYPNGLPKPYSDDATQWLFHGHPLKSENPLQVAVARLLGYRWPAESDKEMELAEEARELIKAVKAFDELTDDDGIFCIPSVNAEQAGADRLRDYLQAVFGSDWNNQTLGQLLTREGASSANLEDWLRKEFFVQHCRVFQNRPFIWNIWDGRPDGFSALVNYHKLTRENLVKLTYTYLGDWIRMCDAKKKSGESGADGLYNAAIKLQEKLIAILEGEAPYDIFVRWKPLEQQPIGWEPDLNDGVRLNIRPFIEAGVLRSKFNLKWGIDRGKNPPGSHRGEVRDNDRHLSLEEKRKAREKLKN